MKTKAHKKCASRPGVTTTEYCILLGLIALVSVASLKALGISTFGLFQNSSKTLATHSTLNLLNGSSPTVQGGSATVSLKGNGYYTIVNNASGQPELQLVDGAQGVATNVSSIDGSKMNTLGTLMLANKLAQLAQAETDPALKNYYGQLAKATYYLGGAEGELDDVPGLDLNALVYNNGDALRDVLAYSAQLQDLMKNPPAGLGAAQFQEVMPLAADAYNIALNYRNTLSQFINPNGTVASFADKTTGASGNGGPGSALTNVNLTNTGTGTHRGDYTGLVGYDSLKAAASKILSDNKVESVPVESTLGDAAQVDAIGSATTTSPSANP